MLDVVGDDVEFEGVGDVADDVEFLDEGGEDFALFGWCHGAGDAVGRGAGVGRGWSCGVAGVAWGWRRCCRCGSESERCYEGRQDEHFE